MTAVEESAATLQATLADGALPSAPRIPLTSIRPSRGWRSLNLCAPGKYREWLYFLAWRDIKVRYKQTVLGTSWAILQPFFTMVVFSLLFGRLAGVPSDSIPHPTFSYAALVPWRASSLSYAPLHSVRLRWEVQE